MLSSNYFHLVELMSLGYKVVEVPVDGVELEVGETKYVHCFLFYLKVLRVAV